MTGIATRLSELLSDCGALAVSFDDAEDRPLYEPEPGTTPLWSTTRVSGLFPGGENSERLLGELARLLAPARLPEPVVEILADQEWARLYRDAFEPTLMDPDPTTPSRIVEVWFSGNHSNVGGGFATDGLSDHTLSFMLEHVSANM